MADISMEQLTHEYFDVLKELGNIGAGNATTALAELINCKVDMSVPQVRLLEFNELGEVLGGEEQVLVGIYLGVEGDVNGSMMFTLPEKAGLHLVNKLMSGMLGIPERDVNEMSFGEMEVSAMKEVGNIITGAYLNALSSLTSLMIYPTPPELGIDYAGALLSVPAAEFGIMGDKILLIQTKFFDDIDLDGYFILIPDMDSYEKILHAIGVV